MKERNINKDIKWKDKRRKDPGNWIWGIASIFFLTIFILSWSQGLIERIVFGSLFIVSFYSFLIHIFMPLVMFNENEINMQELNWSKKKTYKVKRRKDPIKWTNITEINLENKLVGGSWIVQTKPFVIVKTKKERVTSVVHDMNSFFLALKKAGKNQLLNEKMRDKYGKN